ncbi:MAG TPA: hypothetical protein VGK67_30040 [Myxococcales bacterium]
MNRLALIPLFASLALWSCKPPQETSAATPAAPTAVRTTPAPAAAPALAQPQAAAAEPKKGHSCSDDVAVTPASDKITEIKDEKTGATILAVGTKLTGTAPVATVAELTQLPESLAGKTVRVEGNVSAMCGHRRSWFALQSEDKSGDALRVLTAPAFLVPEGSIGKRARAEGVVELIDIPLETAQHYAEAHNLPIQTKAAVVRATGAEFL